jgi:hypothetical protein
LINQKATLLLAVILAAPAFALADNIPGHSKSGINYVSFSEGLTELQGLDGNSARCNFLLSSIKVNGAEANYIARASFSQFAKGDNGSNSGTPLNTALASDSHPVKLADFGGNQGASSNDKDKGKGQGTDNGGDGKGNESGSGGDDPPSVNIAEPGSQTLLLFGLAGLGMLVYLRRTLTFSV